MQALVLGPILYAVTTTKARRWRFGIGVVLDGLSADVLDQACLTVDGQRTTGCKPAFVAHLPAADHGQPRIFARWDVEVERTGETRAVSYALEISGLSPISIDGVSIPALDALPRIAFVSCNGASSARMWNRLEEPFERWEELRQVQQETGIELMIGGGDQVYADSIWELPELAEYAGSNWQKKVDRGPVPDSLSESILRAYVELYVQRWRQETTAGVMARVPGMYTWDDHDIFDGWGSHAKLQDTAVFQAVFRQAAKAFQVLQLGGLVDDYPQDVGFLKTLRFHGGREGRDCIDVVLPDTRSHRGTRQVLGAAQWTALDAWLARSGARAASDGRRHVLFVSPVPVVYLRFGEAVESVGWIADLRDDLVDQWESAKHRGERARLIMTLLDHQAASRSAVTILSGDVHLGARAEIRSRNPRHLFGNFSEVVINQVTSSAIVHPPPSRLEYLGLKALSTEKPDDIGQHVETALLPIGGGTHLLARNWLFIEFDQPRSPGPDRMRMWIEWRAGEDTPDTKVVVEPPALDTTLGGGQAPTP